MFVPELDRIDAAKAPAVFYSTEGVAATAFSMPTLDLESFDLDFRVAALHRLVASLPSSTTLRVITEFSFSDSLWFENSRSEAVKASNYLKQDTVLVFETPNRSPLRLMGQSSQAAESFRDSLPVEELKALGAIALASPEIESRLFLSKHSNPTRKRAAIDGGTYVTGVIRLCKQGSSEIDEGSLASLLNDLPLPFTVTTTLRKVARSVTEYRLRAQFARQSASHDPMDSIRQESTSGDLARTALEGADQFCVEWLITLRRDSEAELRRDCSTVASALSSLGQVLVETVGCAPSFIATLPCSKQHLSFLEYDQTAVLYLPVFSYGESTKELTNPPRRTLVLHRQDGSLHLFDQFSGAFLAYNAIISGKSGSGKSVLANALSESLLSDPNIRMVKIDVGGSYKKECSLFGGTEIDFTLDRPSGINPFRYLRDLKDSNDAVDTLNRWLLTLLREDDESAVPRSLTVELGKIVKAYAREHSESANFQDFIAKTPDFPRKALLSRWALGGIFENAFAVPVESSHSSSCRYRYFNFESIQNAGNPDFAEGVMAAVIAELNLEMFTIGKVQNAGIRLVLFCDETKFFIEGNASFFLHTTANFRKFGHGVILITQKTDTFDLPAGGNRSDSGILLNSPIRFFLEQDVDKNYLKERFGLSDSHLRVLVDQPYRGKEYREFVLQDDTGTRVVRLYLTPKEYWRVTSTREDNDKLQALQRYVPGLSLEEAIECISRS
jgi:type IV secretory pathway VirB4 component